MKSSAFLAACGAALAIASPILQDRRLYVKTDVVVEWVTVTVTEGETATVFHRPNRRPRPSTTTSEVTSSTPVAPPPPPPVTSTTSIPEPVVQPTPEPTPETTEVVIESTPVVESVAPVEPTSEVTVPVSTTQPEAAQPSDYQSAALYYHNVHRANHSDVGPLTWSDKHAEYAKTLAERCVFAHDTSIGGGGYGQNLAMWGSTGNPEAVGAAKMVAQSASDMWYNGEINLFPASDYGKATPDMSNFHAWGHYSQLVWKSTQQVGCATAFCPAGTLYSTMGAWYTVCNYYPAGNMGGAYGQNVLPPVGQASIFAA